MAHDRRMRKTQLHQHLTVYIAAFCLPARHTVLFLDGAGGGGAFFCHDVGIYRKIGYTCGGGGQRRTMKKIKYFTLFAFRLVGSVEAAMRPTIYVYGWRISPLPLDRIYIYIFIIRHFGGEWGFFFSFPGKVNCCCFEIRNPRLREFPLSFLFMLMSFLFFGQTVWIWNETWRGVAFSLTCNLARSWSRKRLKK